jgi:hypothetical protein
MKPLDAINKSMADLITKTGRFGAPQLKGKDGVAGKEVPGLYFSATKMNNFFDIVDQVTKENGGTATLFLKSGDEYVRVATNVKNSDGSRALTRPTIASACYSWKTRVGMRRMDR